MGSSVGTRDVLLQAIIIFCLILGMRYEEIKNVDIVDVTLKPVVTGTGRIHFTIMCETKQRGS